ncbi:transcriptional regulator, partial [bacterium]|nr:transcriptional regulator [bacterium]
NEPNPVCPVSCKIKALIQPVFDQLTDSVKAQLSTTTLASLLAQL